MKDNKDKIREYKTMELFRIRINKCGDDSKIEGDSGGKIKREG